MVKSLEEYKWSSYTEYFKESRIIDVKFVLGMFSDNKTEAIKKFIEYNCEKNEDKCLEYETRKKINDIQAIEIIKEVARINNINDIQKLDKERRNEIIKRLKEAEGLSIRQIARITGISFNIVKVL